MFEKIVTIMIENKKHKIMEMFFRDPYSSYLFYFNLNGNHCSLSYKLSCGSAWVSCSAILSSNFSVSIFFCAFFPFISCSFKVQSLLKYIKKCSLVHYNQCTALHCAARVHHIIYLLLSMAAQRN